METISNQNSNRFLSLDVFRGLTICLMIVVNTPGTGAHLYPYLVHANWFGFTLADLVFPSFLFAMGNAMSFSMGKMKEMDTALFWKKVLKRSFIIFLLGYLMYWFPFVREGVDGVWEFKPISETRIMGVLQRIGLCYLAASAMLYYLSEKLVVIVSVFLLLAYWAILYLFGQSGAELEMATNAVTRFDMSILGNGHIYKRDSIPFDPEGILSTLPSIVNVIVGFLAGAFIRKTGKTYEGIAKLLIVGFLLMALGRWWDLILPISKKLWTGSFVLYTVGIDICVMAILIYFIELKQKSLGVEFCTIFGKNPMFIYLFSELFYILLRLIPVNNEQDSFEWFSEVIIQTIFPGSFGSFVTAILFMLVCWGMGWWLDKKRIYIKI